LAERGLKVDYRSVWSFVHGLGADAPVAKTVQRSIVDP
jgi:hypothetical protein